MFKKIAYTVLTKGIVSIINFLVVIITSRYMGDEGRGEVSLMYLNITLILLFNDLMGGGALVYLIPRLGMKQLFAPVMVWALVSSLLLTSLTNLYFNYSNGYFLWFVLLSFLLNASSVCNMMLNGLNKIKTNNLVSFLQSLVLLVVLFYLVVWVRAYNPVSWFMALALGYGMNLIVSLFFLRREIVLSFSGTGEVVRQLMKFGFIVQLGNIIQLMNYRLGFYLLEHLKGKDVLGVYSTSVSVAESVWVIMNGTSMVLYAAIANNKDKNWAKDVSIRMAKLSFFLTVFVLIILNAIPESFFCYLFGSDFKSMKELILFISPGIAVFGMTGIYSHYFSGTGEMKISSYSSLVGFIATLSISYWLIDLWSGKGAAVASSISYFLSGVYLLVMFRLKTNSTWKKMFFEFKGVLKSSQT